MLIFSPPYNHRMKTAGKVCRSFPAPPSGERSYALPQRAGDGYLPPPLRGIAHLKVTSIHDLTQGGGVASPVLPPLGV